MRLRLAFALLSALAAVPASAAAPRHHPAPTREATPAPVRLGKFDDWMAVTRQENGGTVCFAFAYPSASTPKLNGRGRPVLTVTERPAGRDAVAFGAGFAFGADAEATLLVDQSNLPFYTSGRFAFARDGAAVAAALRKGRQATMRSPAPRNAQVTDTFSLRGFEQAYAAITKACPPS
jgi:hypothetical protein